MIPIFKPALQIAPQERLRGGDDTDLRFAVLVPYLSFSSSGNRSSNSIPFDWIPCRQCPRCGWWFIDSWWQSDLLYRKYFDQGPEVVDEKVVQDYIYQDFNSLKIALGLPSSATLNHFCVLLGNSHQGRPILALRISDAPEE